MNIGRFLVIVVLGIFGAFLAFKLVGFLLAWAVHAIIAIALPAALLLGVLYVIFRLTDRRALGSNDRSILP